MLQQIKKAHGLFDLAMRRRVTGLFGLMLLASVLEMASIGMFIPMLRVVADPPSATEMPLIRDVYAWLAPADTGSFLIQMGMAMFFFYVVKNLLLAFVVHVNNRFVFTSMAQLAGRLVNSYLNKPYSYHLSRNSAELIRNVMESVTAVFNNMILPFLNLILELLLSIATLAIIVTIEPLGTLAIGLFLGLASLLFYRTFQTRVGIWGRLNQDYSKMALLSLQQGLGSVKESKILGRESYFSGRFIKFSERRALIRANLGTMNQLPRMFLETVAVAGIVLIIALISLHGATPADMVATLGIFAVAAFRLLPAMNRIVSSATNIRESAAALDNIHSDLIWKAPPPPETAQAFFPPFAREIRLEEVTYSYPGSEAKVLDRLEMTIKKGQTVALVGASGAGKSTLADMILGLIAPTSGRLMVDGIDIQAIGAGWQGRIGYVPQSIYLLDDSVRRNVAFGVRDDEIDDNRVKRALAGAHLLKVVEDLPQGMDTFLGEHGTRLSGGQRQRIGIARALYHDPEVLVFDEATSALDNETEQEISTALEELHGNKTIILIAHRLSTVRHCDRLFFLKAGRLAGEGTFDQLAATHPDFQRFVDATGYDRRENHDEG